MTIRELIETAVRKNPSKTYLYFKDQEISYQEFNNTINKVANMLLKLGLKKGDRACIMLPNCPEFLYCWLGLNKIGAVMIPINTAFKGEETKYIVNHSEAKVVITSDPFSEIVLSIRESCPDLKHVIYCGEQSVEGTQSFSDLIKGSACEVFADEVFDDDDAVFIYTSGTTGPPKGCVLSHQTYTLIGQIYSRGMGLTPKDRFMSSFPLFHANAQVFTTMGTLTAGASYVLLERFSVSQLWDQVRNYKPSYLTLPMAVIPWVWEQPRTEQDADNSLKVLQIGNIPKEYFKEFERRFNVTILTMYGLTECPVATMHCLGKQRKIGSVGLPIQHPDPSVTSEVRIVDEEGNEVPRGTVGEITIKNVPMMKGYFKEPEKTEQSIKDGRLFTGDKGYVDEDGCLYFVDRGKDIIRRRGENISSKEIEIVINQHPKVVESAVIGVPSGLVETDEAVKAYVIVAEGETLPPEELVQWCEERLASFKVPRYIEYRQSFPRTTGLSKVQKELLKKEKACLTEGCFDREAKGK